MLIGPQALQSLNSIEKIHPRMMVATFNGNHRATIISCYSPTNISEETELITFYDDLSSLVRSIPKHNVLDIGGDMNAQIEKNGNHKYSRNNSSKRNGQHQTDFYDRKLINMPKYKLSKKGRKIMDLHIRKQY